MAYVGDQHGPEGPALVVSALDGWIQQNPATGIRQPQAEFNVLDGGTVVGGGVKPPELQKATTAHGATASPEAADGAWIAAMGVVVQEVAEATHHPRGGWTVVVTAEHRIKVRIGPEVGSKPIQGVGVQFHIGVNEHQQLRLSLSSSKVARRGGAGANAGGPPRKASSNQPLRSGRRRTVEDDQGFIPRREAGDGRLGAARKRFLPANCGHHQGQAGEGAGRWAGAAHNCDLALSKRCLY